MYEHIKLSIEGGIATITIDRQSSNNALNAQMFRDLISTVEHCDANDAVKVVIVTGAGKNFSAGGASRRWQRSSSSATSSRC